VGAIALAGIVLWQMGGPPFTSSYGRSYWLQATLAFVLTELPYVVALIRTWKVADRAGIAIAMAASATQVLLTIFVGLLHPAAPSNFWSWLSASVSFVTIIVAYLAWRPYPSRKGDVGILISIFLGFLAYTVIAQIALALLRARLHV
jgi:hypothetical protein